MKRADRLSYARWCDRFAFRVLDAALKVRQPAPQWMDEAIQHLDAAATAFRGVRKPAGREAEE